MNTKNKKYDNTTNPCRVKDIIRREYPLLADRIEMNKLQYELSTSIELLKQILIIVDNSCFIKTNCKLNADEVYDETVDAIFELYETLDLLEVINY